MPQYWYVVEALVVLGKITRHRERTVTRDDLIACSEKFQARRRAPGLALEHLAACGLARRIPKPEEPAKTKPGTWTYALTPEGIAAAKAARDAWKHAALSTAGRKGASSPSRGRGAFCARLWALFRMRRTISAPEAAATLVDAGSDVTTATNTASQYLRLWADTSPEAIQVSKQRGPRGAHRFVMVQDLGPNPPVTTYKAQGEAAA